MGEDGPGSRQTASAAMVLLGRITGAHGIQGDVKIASFTDPPDNIASYGELVSGAGRRFVIERARVLKGTSLAVALAGVRDRDAAEALKATDLFVVRDQLPETDDDEWYYGDLVGLSAQDQAGTEVGEVVAIQNFGAGDLIEIRRPGQKQTDLLPFTKEAVPVVDVAGRRVVVVFPQTIEAEGDNV